MLDISIFTRSEIQKCPVSKIKYPGSCNIANTFHRNVLSQIKHFLQLKGLFKKFLQGDWTIYKRVINR
jgi:hypothetical protein